MKKRILSAFIMLAMLAAVTGCGSGQRENTPADHTARDLIIAETSGTNKTEESTNKDRAQMQDETDVSSKTNKSDDSVEPKGSISKEEPITGDPIAEDSDIEETIKEDLGSESIIVDSSTEQSTIEEPDSGEEKAKMLRMMIGNTAVAVEWETNESVEALKALCKNEPLVIQMSMYGGFEQVGSIGTTLPSNDAQTTTSAGDIVLYSSSQIVVFYGSNSWAYTRLGHITDQDASGMADLLSNGNVTVTISMEDTE